MKRYRILHILHSMNRGGAETLVMNLFRAIDRDRYAFDFLLCTGRNDYGEEITRLGGRIFLHDSRGRRPFAYRRDLVRFFTGHAGEFDAVHLHCSSLTSPEALFAARDCGIPVRVLHVHSSRPESRLHGVLHRLFRPAALGCATQLLACSEAAADWLCGGTPFRRRVLVVRNGINTERFRFDERVRREVRRELGVFPGTTLFGHVGRFCAVKNHPFLLRVFAAWEAEHPDSLLLLIGRGEGLDAARDLARDLGIGAKVRFLGLRRDIDRLLQAIDLFVFPSFFEGLPVAVVEAQDSGTKVVCSDRVSAEAKLCDNLWFLPLESGPAEWARRIARLTGAPREQMWLQVRAQRYDIRDTAELLCKEVYRR
ncbi:glycosyltransferase [uncultured Alistipes sp.]|jgi:glycosyltransferase involved in cell wall biosynthesis|uniref:glycosyltransferase n=1 Tax=uncultured Alistipes sp. TaxID=538949 RepID=UPI0025DACFD0|nr:glycosyltransferase [uncultured Alistipes sp.]